MPEKHEDIYCADQETPQPLTSEKLRKVCILVAQTRETIISEISDGLDIREVVNGWMSGLKLAILQELSCCVEFSDDTIASKIPPQK